MLTRHFRTNYLTIQPQRSTSPNRHSQLVLQVDIKVDSTTVDELSSLVESMMDDTTSTGHKTTKRFRFSKNKARSEKGAGEEGDDDAHEEQAEADVEAWDTLSKSFRRVQTVLDKNRELIQQANDNHQSKIPDNIAKNVGLIREINGNISKVISIYSDLSTDFSSIVSQRKRMKNNDGHTESSES